MELVSSCWTYCQLLLCDQNQANGAHLCSCVLQLHLIINRCFSPLFCDLCFSYYVWFCILSFYV